MIAKKELKMLGIILGLFLLCYWLPVDTLRESARVKNALWESLYLVKWYAREHVLLCLIPAFFIAGAIGVFVSQGSVMKYLGAGANKAVAFGVASVSGTILAVCSCTVLPLFAGIYRMGAGLGPACAFLYSGPAINVLAIVLTAQVLGTQLGIARAVGAILFSIVIGVCMHLIYRKEELAKVAVQGQASTPDPQRALWQNTVYFASLVGILVFANWSKPAETVGVWHLVFSNKWVITTLFGTTLVVVLFLWFSRAELGEWVATSWGFAKQILPLLLIGVAIAGILLGRTDHEGLVPTAWVSNCVGGNSIRANFFAAIAGAFMYFATLTEVPILQGLISNGMGKGPALALLLAGPALSLPNMLVIRSVMGTRKTIVFVVLVIVMATISGTIFGAFFT
jgi:uncharacterized protein